MSSLRNDAVWRQSQRLVQAASLTLQAMTSPQIRRQSAVPLPAPAARDNCFESVIQALDVGIAVYRAIDDGDDFAFVCLNPAGEQISGVPSVDAVGRRLSEVFPGSGAFGLLAVLHRVWRSGDTESLPATEYKDDRTSPRWLENRVYRLPSNDVVAVFADVTERIHTEQQLRYSEDRYRLLSESTLDGIFDWNLEEGALYLSPRWKAQLGFAAAELPNAPETWSDRLHPDDRTRVLAHLARFLKNPRHLWEEEFRLLHKKGHYAWMLARGTAMLDKAGKVSRLLGVQINIDARHQAEQRFRDLVETTNDWVWETDNEDRYVYVSPRCKHLLGYEPQELVGKSRLTPIHPDTMALSERFFRRCREKPADYSMEELSYRHRDGTRVYIETSGVPVFDEHKVFKGYRGIDRDITSRHLANERLQLYERLASTTHDSMSYIDRQYTYRLVNEAHARSHQLPADSIIGLRVDELLGKKLFEEVIQPRLERCFAGENVDYQYEFDLAGGKKLMDVQYTPYQPTPGVIEGAVITAHDITELHRVQERLKINGERLSLALQAGHQGMFDVNLQTGRFIVNSEYACMLGFEPAEFQETLETWLSRMHDDDRYRVQRHLDGYLQGDSDEYRIEFRQRSAEGHWKWILSVGRLVERDADGKPLRLIGTHTDISPLKAAEEKVRQAAQVFSSTIEGVTITDLDGTILDVNQAFCDITGYDREEVIGQNPRVLQSGRHDQHFYKTMWQALQTEGRWRGEIWNRRKDGMVYPETLTIGRVSDDDGKPTGYVAVFADITTSKQTEERLAHLAHHDTLTGLPNRLLLSARLDQSVIRSKRLKQKLAVLFVDLDRFKHVNDSIGHAAGDDLLRQFATRIGDLVRAEDTVARISGDEFVVLIENVKSADDATLVTNKLMQVFKKPFQLEGHAITVTGSVGISLFPDDGTESNILLRNADTAMYRAKDDGRNTYAFYAEEMTAAAFEHMFLENALRGALRNHEFALVYQPQLDLGSGRIAGLEALLRWRHPAQGSIPPSRFIPIAEQRGLIGDIDQWVLNEACRQAREWSDAGLPFGRIAINISGSEIQRRNFADDVFQTLERHGLRPEQLELEVTETCLMERAGMSMGELGRLNDAGITLAIDDFSSDYSSLAHLKSLPVDKLKIERAFVRNIPGDANDRAIAEAVIALGKALDLETVAEGIETAEQLRFLQKRGCKLGQGYFLAKPEDAAVTTERLQQAQASEIADTER